MNKKPFVLIISSFPDLHAEEVIKYLNKSKVQCVLFESNKIHSGSRISLNEVHGYIITKGKNEYRLSDFTSVWYRKPDFWWEDYGKLTEQEGLMSTYKFNESMALIRGLMHEAKKKKIYLMSPLQNLTYWSNKPLQLALAADCGLTVPHYLISSNKNDLQLFIEKYPHSITKSITSGNVIFGKYQLGFTTKRFNIDSVQVTDLDYPIYIQEEIHKKIELRITVVKGEFFSCSIDSQKLVESRIDWREVDPKKMAHNIFQLPQLVKNKLLKLVTLMELEYATIDMAITPNDEYIFYEINPNGQYLWIEQLTGLPISNSIALSLSVV